ncbi:hypothetical protein STEG23_018210, partial [Scotinomys teguina]
DLTRKSGYWEDERQDMLYALQTCSQGAETETSTPHVSKDGVIYLGNDPKKCTLSCPQVLGEELPQNPQALDSSAVLETSR